MPASEKDIETARQLFGCKGDITEYIVDLGASIENTTWSEINAVRRGRAGSGGKAPSWGRGGLP